MLCVQFKLDPTGNKQRMLNTVNHYLHSCHLRNKPAVIMVDEAQDLEIDTLSELRILTNFERDAFSVFTLILSGKPALASMIQNKEKLEFAGGSNILMDDGAFRVLCESSQGISHIIDHIMSDALKWGIQLNHRTLDAEIIQRAVDSQSLI